MWDLNLDRNTPYLEHPVFNSYHTEHEMLRYLKSLENKDLSLAHSMIALGSCTMKLNATTEMIPVTWEAFGNIHPFAPKEQLSGYTELLHDLERDLSEITGFHKVSLQPNAGAKNPVRAIGQRAVEVFEACSHGLLDGGPAQVWLEAHGVVLVGPVAERRAEADAGHLSSVGQGNGCRSLAGLRSSCGQ